MVHEGGGFVSFSFSPSLSPLTDPFPPFPPRPPSIPLPSPLSSSLLLSFAIAAQGNKRAMQRLTELKKLGADKRAPAGKGGKGGARPTRKDAETECIIS